ncbi:tetratricopeptide repeat protein (plasmid) [Deinococcus metallilatus]|uniref:ATPase/DNA-binding SARP family transcriptional activator n=1 Tax=Deinococcus metallilatus TaxID=1211322 RepID=A0ABR6MNN1_9DEIO|nr:tetratricopeptide repeat protein [Deinococcus metallilatus]MBB5293553.1 putative ATPase/DNA-binding SARP family transcriptional activator [Deinococcus metallilatus]QBY06625.1 tetratricopeptide repeat protein [Deinococcus metallilatus]RXJ17968.1 tetratricopeptide repeat protein [Deinococcus metallilatus]GMA15226.1 transcriptional activator [Deinococcus metallilatus]
MATTLFLFGSPRLQVDGHDEAWLPDRCSQLLTYLACRTGWVGREQLQYLFWPDHAPDMARGNLRQLLSRVRARSVPGLEVERERLRWRVETDLAAFLRAVSEHRWAEALTHASGPFLAGWEGTGTGEFAAWLEREREHLCQATRAARLGRAHELEEEGCHLEAADLLQPLLEGDEFDEAALRVQVAALLKAGGRERALRTCGTFVQRLRAELGLEPTAELAGLIRTLQSPEAAAPPAPAARLSGVGLPTSAASFIGRSLELAEIARLLARPDVRLLTLTGPGGIGKTRLAVEAARGLAPSFPDGVAFVSLAALSDPALVAPGIAEGLGLPLEDRADPLGQVVRFIGAGRRLLVLDNYEHLLGGVTVALKLVRGCPNLRLIVTSRERLGLEDEWLLPLSGLDHPQEAEVGEVEGRHFDAVQLFLDRARRVRPQFTPGGDLHRLFELCRLVEGSPLALELAAVWTRSLPLAEIVREIRENLDFLTSRNPDKAGRHRSLRAVFESSWGRLTPLGQETLRRLAVFRGGFRLEAARVVTGASPAVLAALVDASLLWLGPGDRYFRHALLHQYMREKLAGHPREQRETERRHAHYYLALLGERGDAILGPEGGAALAALDGERENIRAAWDHAAAAWPGDLRPAVVQAALYYDRRARFQEGFTAYGRAARTLRGDSPSQRAFLGDVLVRQGWFAMRLGQHGEARELAARGLALVPPGSVSAMHGHNALGTIAEHTGDYAEAGRHFREALRLAGEHVLPARQADLSTHLAAVEAAQGHYREAEAHLREALVLYRKIGYHVGLAFGLAQQGNLLLALGRPEEAGAAFRQGLTLAQDLGVHQRVPPFLQGLAEVAYARGAYEEARQLGEEELERGRKEGSRSTQIAALGLLGRVSAAQGKGAAAGLHLGQALHLAWSAGETPRVLELLTALAGWQLTRGEAREALPLLLLVECHPAAEERVKELARRLRRTLEGQLPPQALAQAQADPASLNSVVTEVLAGLDSA